MTDAQADGAIRAAENAFFKHQKESKRRGLTKRIAFAIMRPVNNERINMTKQNTTTNTSTVKSTRNGRRVALIVLPWAILYTLIVLAAGAYLGNQFMSRVHASAQADAVSAVTALK